MLTTDMLWYNSCLLFHDNPRSGCHTTVNTYQACSFSDKFPFKASHRQHKAWPAEKKRFNGQRFFFQLDI